MKRIKSGFTLVELLVVIGIIGLLTSILIPTINSARISAWTAMCKSNMHSMGVAFVQYGNNNLNALPPQAFWNTSEYWISSYNPMPTTLAYDTRYVKSDATTTTGPVTLMKPFGIGSLYDAGLIKEFEMFYCPGFKPRNNPEKYTEFKQESYVDPVTGAYYTTTEHILTGYHYFKNNVSMTNEMGTKSFLYDLIYDWTTVPHSKSNGKPRGLNVLYGDGHVVFDTDCVDEKLWGDLTGGNTAQTPWGNLDLWFPIIEKAGNNAPNLQNDLGGSWSNFTCLGKERDSGTGTQGGTWTYGP